MSMKCVVLNSTYEILSVEPVRKGLMLVLKGKAQVMKKHPHRYRSESGEYHLPATVLMNYYIATRKTFSTVAQLNNRNLFVRDGHTCQYCDRGPSQFRRGEFLTRDHVHPKTLGGKDIWENVVTSCSTCNNKKDNKLLKDIPDMSLSITPRAPSIFDLYIKSYSTEINFNISDLVDMEMN